MIEKRQQPRMALSESVPVMKAGTDEPLGRLINLSLDGFMVVGDTQFSPGTHYQLRAAVEMPELEPTTLDLDARCIWCQRSSYSQQYGAGFALDERSEALTQAINRLLRNAGS